MSVLRRGTATVPNRVPPGVSNRLTRSSEGWESNRVWTLVRNASRFESRNATEPVTSTRKSSVFRRFQVETRDQGKVGGAVTGLGAGVHPETDGPRPNFRIGHLIALVDRRQPGADFDWASPPIAGFPPGRPPPPRSGRSGSARPPGRLFPNRRRRRTANLVRRPPEEGSEMRARRWLRSADDWLITVLSTEKASALPKAWRVTVSVLVRRSPPSSATRIRSVSRAVAALTPSEPDPAFP